MTTPALPHGHDRPDVHPKKHHQWAKRLEASVSAAMVVVGGGLLIAVAWMIINAQPTTPAWMH